MTPALAGFATGLALIVAIGAQNAYVLRQGVRREHMATVALICIMADVVLIAVGTLGVGAVVQSHPAVLTVATWAGATYLVWFAIGAFRRAWSPQGLTLAGDVTKSSVVLTTLALTLLNPHVYLDTVIMLGSIANTFGEARWVFAGGAMVASICWFTLLASCARGLAKPLASPRTWRYLDVGIGLMMLGFAIKLVL